MTVFLHLYLHLGSERILQTLFDMFKLQVICGSHEPGLKENLFERNEDRAKTDRQTGERSSKRQY